MKLVSAGSEFSAAACARWHHVAATSTIEGPTNGMHDRYEADVELNDGESPDSAFERVRAHLFAYDVFPSRLMRSVICPDAPLREGSVLVQRVRSGPLAIESAVRVLEVWDRGDDKERAAGFRYVTLAGHPERGVASFEVRLSSDDQVTVVIESRSVAGSAVTSMGRPLARRVQRRLTIAALEHLANAQ
ncbi:MAG TPA: DUF1990 family protein [Candidatus Dormibacteraeota bacterium]|nr:DUF1990 family protein [Candidatus Dormibacteraeota bacterium]